MIWGLVCGWDPADHLLDPADCLLNPAERPLDPMVYRVHPVDGCIKMAWFMFCIG